MGMLLGVLALLLVNACGGGSAQGVTSPQLPAPAAAPTPPTPEASAEPNAPPLVPAPGVDVGTPAVDGGAVDAGASASDAGQVRADATAALLELTGQASLSLGSPSDGRVEGAIALPGQGPGFRHNPRRPHEARFGSVEMLQAIARAAARVHGQHGGEPLVVNDLGLEHGGPIRQHGSHQSGRDADILFYVLDRQGESLPSVGVPLDPAGRGWDFKDLSIPEDDVRVRLDARRTWAFMAALLEVSADHVQRIFIVEHVRSLLLQEAHRQKAPRALVRRFSLVSCQPGTPHDDHMHVRFFCTPEDQRAGCLDKPPVYPFRRAALRAEGLEPALATARPSAAKRKARAARTTTPAQARRKAGKMHWKVRKFLDRRQAWLPKPSPGRPFCR